MSVFGQVIYIALYCFLIVLIFRLVMDYVFQFARSWQPGKAMVVVLEAAYTVTDPPLKLLRRVIRRCVSGAWRSTCPSSY